MEKSLVLTEHARFRMHLRRISMEAINEVFAHPILQATDMLTDYSIVVGNGPYGPADRLLTVIYEETDQEIRIVSVHPIRASQYRMRVRRGRWKPA